MDSRAKPHLLNYGTRSAVLLALALNAAAAGCTPGEPRGDPARGRALYNQTTVAGAPGCINCHGTSEENEKLGPPHNGIATRAEQTIRSDEYQGDADDIAGYLRESIVRPNRYVLESYQPGVMVQDYGERMSDQQIADLVAYLLTLK